MINILLLGDKLATKIHRKFSRHHVHVIGYTYKLDNEGNEIHLGDIRDIKNKIEAVIDWESARFTKPDKPLNAYQTWKKYYSDIDMRSTLKLLGFWEDDENDD
jgi:predicted Ser/Thr protein kinase